MATDRLPNSTQMADAVAALQTIANKSQTPYNASNKLPTDYADDTNQTHKFATQAQLDQITLNETNISSINNTRFKMVAHTSATAATSIEYTTNVADFDSTGEKDRTSGSYLVVCTNWSTTPAPYIGLISFSGGNTANFVKTDVVTGFNPTITITPATANATISISGAGRISIYAIL